MKKVREGYKITELGEIPNDWNIMKLSEVAEIVMGQSPDSSSYNDIQDGVAFFQGKTEFGRINPVVKKWCNNPTKISKPLDILISVRAPVGDVNINNIEACIGRGLGAIRASSNSNYKYLYYSIQKYNNQLKKASQGSTFEAINSNDLKGLKLLIPHIDEQEKIALILSTVDKQIDNVDALIEKNKELKKGLMQTLLIKGIGHTKFKKTEIGEIPEEWELESMNKIVTSTQLGTNTLGKENEKIPMLKMGNLTIGGFDFNKLEYISEEELEMNKEYILSNGDFLFNTRNTLELVGKSAVWNSQIDKAIFNSNIMRIKYCSKINDFYMGCYFSSDIGWKQLKSISTGTTSVAAIYTKDLMKIKVIIPSIGEQEKIVSILLEVDKKIEEYENKKQKLEELKKGLMQQLLTGKIRVI